MFGNFIYIWFLMWFDLNILSEDSSQPDKSIVYIKLILAVPLSVCVFNVKYLEILFQSKKGSALSDPKNGKVQGESDL